ncbi:alpha/beta fold hydrolase [Piscinibacter sp.]|jgi:pimeloyl-ACP methyl ester carboxylesterase/DNA-binding CsgD family transcriptional regulator|uniref:alpha/beta fold hydrolase n=1 Tax=Piscinibacter sp. TaxID=1903157 RepID=UPI002F417281
MDALNPEIRFAHAVDGTRIAHATTGSGYPLVRAAHWLGHLDYDWQTPVWRPWIEALSARYQLIRYDSRGCGLSEHAVDDFTLDKLVSDLEAVVDAEHLAHFALMGMSQGGAVAIAYAARHPDRVSHLVLCGAFARGALRRDPSPEQAAAVAAMIKLVELGWGQANPAFLQMFTSQFFPSASLVQMHAFNEIQRHSAPPRAAAKIVRAFADLDATEHLAQVRAPTLVFHGRGDNRVPFDEGLHIAASIADARFEPLDTDNHLPLEGEPAFKQFLDTLAAFLPRSPPSSPPAASLTTLTRREREILELIARGLDNAQIAARLDLAEKTVRNNITVIFDKFEVENRAQAIVKARTAGLGV